MTISSPITLPTDPAPRAYTIRARSAVGVQAAPQSFEQTVYAWQGDGWELDLELPPMTAEEAEPWLAALLSLNGRERTFAMGPWGYAGARGTWNGASPIVVGAHAAGVQSVLLGNLDGKTGKAGDWLQFGSGSSRRLHKLLQDFTQTGSPSTVLAEIYPRTRAALSNGAAVTLASPMGLWRLASNAFEWKIEEAMNYGLRFACVEARDG